MKRIFCILLLLACVANAETWIYGRSRLSTGYRQEKNNGKIPFSLYPPALWYEFNYDDSTVVYDLSGNNNTGTVSGATWVQETEGGYYSFDKNNDSITTKGSSTITSQVFTVSLWVKPSTLSGIQNILDQREAASACRGQVLYLNTTTLNYLSTVNGTTWGISLSKASVTPTNAWTHIAITHTNALTKLYINASSVATSTTAGTIVYDAGQIVWGYNNPKNSNPYGGLMDVPIYYQTVLTDAQITSLYLRGR